MRVTQLVTFTSVDNPQMKPAPQPTEASTAELLAYLGLDYGMFVRTGSYYVKPPGLEPAR